MADNNNNDINVSVLLGQVDGKLDLVIAGQQSQSKRIDELALKVAALETVRATSASWRTSLFSIGAIAISVVSLLRGFHI